MESLDIKKNSRKAWKLLSRLEGKHTPAKSLSIKPQAVSLVLVKNFRIIIDKMVTKRVKKDIQNLIKICQPQSDVTERFSIHDVSHVINEL